MNTQLLHLFAGSQPILLVGCHRSGTTFLAQLCANAGLFLGSDLFEQHESNHFMQLHDRLLALAGARWNQPGPFLDRMAGDPDFADSVDKAILRDLLRPEFFHRFHGYRNYLTRHLGRHRPWGWKDPRTSLLLARYIRIFPGCSILHICRNGIDVAASLVQRDLAEEGRDGSAHDEPRRLATAFDLWKCYEESILDAVQKTGHDNYLRVRFEDLVLDDRRTIDALSGFLSGLGLEPPDTGDSRAGNALKFKDSPKLVDFYRSRRDEGPMQAYGYSAIVS